MLKKIIKFNGLEDPDTGKAVEYEQDFYFHLSEDRYAKIAATYQFLENPDAFFDRVVAENDYRVSFDFIEELVHQSYGVRGEDGKSFIQSDRVWENFRYTDAYSKLITEFFSDEDSLMEFFKGVMPAKIRSQIQDELDPKAIQAAQDKARKALGSSED